jgi:hypothetical protein
MTTENNTLEFLCKKIQNIEGEIDSKIREYIDQIRIYMVPKAVLSLSSIPVEESHSQLIEFRVFNNGCLYLCVSNLETGWASIFTRPFVERYAVYKRLPVLTQELEKQTQLYLTKLEATINDDKK